MSTLKNKLINKIKNNKPKPTAPVQDKTSKILELLKKSELDKALDMALSYLTKYDRVEYVFKKFAASKYRTYSLGMRRLEAVISEFIRSKDISVIKEFEKRTREESINNFNAQHTMFNGIRHQILTDACSDNPGSAAIALMGIIEDANGPVLGNTFEVTLNKYKRNLILEICKMLSPESKGLGVLYSEKR